MILNSYTPNIEVSADLEEQLFSIGDVGVVFDILRNKMYANNILAICREISCNARDAHREVCKPDEPIHITLPSALDPYYRIKDFGPGISPDRMENIFIRYGMSTKRDNNIQCGSFGMGAKTPFSYTDSFAIVTNYDGIQYSYACIIDETKVGKLILTSKSATTEENGTEILIPIKEKNFNEFHLYTEQACRHWKVKPIISGGNINWDIQAPILEGNKWAIVASKSHYDHNAKVIVDGIEYPIDMDILRKYAGSKIIDSCRGDFIMYFGVGEISLSANREQLSLDEKTQHLIRGRLDSILREVKQIAHDKIEAIPNFWDANIYYQKEMRQAFANLDFLGTLSWHGTTLFTGFARAACQVHKFTKGDGHRRHRNPNKIYRATTQHLTFEDKSILYVNDINLKDITARHIKKAFENDAYLQSVQVICPTDVINLTVLEDSIHLSLMNPQNLSAITKGSNRTYKKASSRVLVFKLDTGCSGFRQSSYSAMDEDPNERVLCLLTANSSGRQAILKNGTYLPVGSMNTLATHYPDVSFYGIDSATPADRIKEDFSDLQDIEKFLKKNIVNNKSYNFVERKWAAGVSDPDFERLLSYRDKLKTLIDDPQSVMLARLQLHQKAREILKEQINLTFFYEAINGEIVPVDIANFIKQNPKYDMATIISKYDKQYPILEHINKYYYDDILQPMADYVNIVDKFYGEQNV